MSKNVILCVDDEMVVLESLKSELTNKLGDKYILEFAENSAEALEVTRELMEDGANLALIICDYIMPGIKGDDLLVIISNKFPDTKQVMLTGQADLDGITNTVNNANLYRYISKPWEKNDLFLTIKEAVKSYEQGIQLKEHHRVLEETVKIRTMELEKSLTDLKQSQQQLVKSEKMAALGGLVAGVAHEINTPVGVGVTAASTLDQKTRVVTDLFKKEDLSYEELKEYLETCTEGTAILLRNLNCAANLIKSFKNVAIDQSTETKRKFKLREYLGEILVSLKPRFKNNFIKIDIDCPEDLALVSYPGAISQIITNLLLNSLMHGFRKGEEGLIKIQCGLDDGALKLKYSDNGKGADKETLEKIFDPFFTTNRKAGGTGLGMHIIYNLITHKLNGTIVCESSPGKGVLFCISIPV